MFYRVRPQFSKPFRPSDKIIAPENLIAGYAAGIFPMAVSGQGPVDWFTASPRGIIDLEKFHVPANVRRALRQNEFEERVDTEFETVVRACGDREQTWISEAIVQSYLELYELRLAHSVESWRGGKLVGGIYGVAWRGAFFGESMFFYESGASKVALARLLLRLKAREFKLFDIQMVTPATEPFGAEWVPLETYLERLETALEADCKF